MIAFYCVEDSLSRDVVLRLLTGVLGDVSLTELQPNQGGFGSIKGKIGDYCTLAQHHHVFILTDLDELECPPSLRRGWMQSAGLTDPLPEKMCFNVAVTEVEAWLLADKPNLSDYLGIPIETLPEDTEIPDPKEFLLSRVESHGNRLAKMELLPKGAARVGLGYNHHLGRFASEYWDFNGAAERNSSLHRAIERMSAHR